MNAERLLEHYERFADAPNAIRRLRRFVLDLAVRGRLVSQDPLDEPASELLKHISAEKTRQVTAGRTRSTTRLPALGSHEIPYRLPDSWIWARIREVTSDRGQTVPKSTFTYIDVTSIDKEAGRIASAAVLSEHEAPSRARKVVSKGDVIYSCVRPYLLNIAIIEHDIDPPAIASTAFAVLNGFGLVLPKYQWIVLRSEPMIALVEDKMRGQAYPAINDSDFAVLPFPLPPLAEQHRIVAKVDEIMGLCDDIEAKRTEREATRDRFASATLARLNAPDPDRFADHARFTIQSFNALTTRGDQIKRLREAIVNLAVRGHLVRQDPADEPIEVAPSSDNKRAWLLPAKWRHARLADLLVEDTRNGYSRKPDDAPDGTPILRISAGTVRSDGVVAEEEHKLISAITAEVRLQYGLRRGDLVACRFNGNKAFVGRLAMFADYLGIQPIYPDKLIRVRVAPNCAVPEYIRLASTSDLVTTEIEAFCATTVGNWGISATNLKEVKFPVPPVGEQRRIVTKVDQLMALCTQLEASLTTEHETRSRLLDAVIAEVLTTADSEAVLAIR